MIDPYGTFITWYTPHNTKGKHEFTPSKANLFPLCPSLLTSDFNLPFPWAIRSQGILCLARGQPNYMRVVAYVTPIVARRRHHR